MVITPEKKRLLIKIIFNIVKYGFIHVPALVISVVMLIEMFVCLTNEPGKREFFLFFAMTVDLSCQYFRARARGYNRYKPEGYKWKLFWLWLLIGVYVLGCAAPSAIGVFAGEIKTVEVKQDISDFSRQANKDEYDRLKAELTTKTISRDDEEKNIKNGVRRGIKYQELDGQVKNLESKLAVAKMKVESSGDPGPGTDSQKSPFLSLQQMTGLSANILKIVMLSAGLLINFSLLLITPWELPKSFIIHEEEQEKTPKNETDNETAETDNFNFETLNVIEKKCPTCGMKFPARRNDAVYCCGNCRLKAFREKLTP